MVLCRWIVPAPVTVQQLLGCCGAARRRAAAGGGFFAILVAARRPTIIALPRTSAAVAVRSIAVMAIGMVAVVLLRLRSSAWLSFSRGISPLLPLDENESNPRIRQTKNT